jgi:hypothetical protein
MSSVHFIDALLPFARGARVFVLAAAVFVGVGCDSRSPGSTSQPRSPSRASRPTPASAPACDPSLLSVSSAGHVSDEMGWSSAAFSVRNQSDKRCTVRGYPTVRLLDKRGRRLPFYYHRGGHYASMSVPPRPVVLAPNTRAWFVLAKRRCDAGALRLATVTVVTLPGAQRAARLRRNVYPVIAYCRADHGPNRYDPGNLVDVGSLVPHD